MWGDAFEAFFRPATWVSDSTAIPSTLNFSYGLAIFRFGRSHEIELRLLGSLMSPAVISKESYYVRVKAACGFDGGLAGVGVGNALYHCFISFVTIIHCVSGRIQTRECVKASSSYDCLRLREHRRSLPSPNGISPRER